jgi:hypothetical protein
MINSDVSVANRWVPQEKVLAIDTSLETSLNQDAGVTNDFL